MKSGRKLSSTPDFEPFSYRGWSFLYCIVPDDRGQFWPVIFSELCWPSGRPVVRSASEPCPTPGLAKRCAQRNARAWVKQRTCAAACDR